MAVFIASSVVVSLGYFIDLKKSCLTPSTARRFLGYICSLKIKKDRFAELREAFLARKAFLLKRSRSSPVKLHLLPSSFRQLSYTPILFLELLVVLLAKLNCLPPFERKFPTGVSLIAGKDSFLGEANLTYRFNCYRMPLILDGADVFLALVDPKL